MISFREYLTEAARRSLSRLMGHMDGPREMGVISAYRGSGERSASENKANSKSLEQSIKKSGYSYFPVHGRYVEDHGGKQVPVKEKSFVVMGHKEGDTGLHDFLKGHATAFNQDSFIHKPHDSKEANIHAPNRDVDYLGLKKGEHSSIGEFHPNRIPEYAHTVLTRGGGKPGKTPAAHKTFAFSKEPHNSEKKDFPSVP